MCLEEYSLSRQITLSPYRRERSWHSHIKNPYIKALLIAREINHFYSSRHFFFLWNIILLNEYYFLPKSVLSCISWTYKLPTWARFSPQNTSNTYDFQEKPESICWYVGYSLQFSQISKSSQLSMMFLRIIGKILFLSEHI